MTLFKQIAIMLTLFLLIILGTVLVLNFNSANESAQDRLYEDAKNTASSLSLSLGSANGDISMMSTMINANFDSGTYSYISLVDVDDKILYERVTESELTQIPQWFLNIIDISAPIASANVSAGWNQVGILNVQSDVAYAHKQLYTILINLLMSFSILAIIALLTLYGILSAILKPLKKVQYQAEAVGRNEFIIQEKIPYTKEFKDVVVGMNKMVSKVQTMFNKGNEQLKRQKELEYVDADTGLKNRKYLIDKLPEYLKVDATSKGGVNIMVALSGVIEANEKIGHREVDTLFIKIADIFKAQALKYNNSIVSRMNGTEFSILLPDCNEVNGLEIAQNVHRESLEIITQIKLNEKETFLSLGLYEYNYTQSITQLLSLSDNALTQAKFSESNIHLDKAQNAAEVMGKDAWRDLITDALDANRFRFTSWTAVDAQKKIVAHNALSLTLESNDGVKYFYGQFMAPANQAGLSSKIYQNVMQMMFMNPDKKLKSSMCSIRLSFEYLDLSETYDELSILFKKYAKELPFKLTIEMPDKLVRSNAKAVKLYKKLFETYGIETAVYEFIGESADYQYLRDLRPVYIKGESSYFLTQSEQSLSALRLITDTIGISLIATGVMDINALHKLQEKDIHIIQGKATEMLTLL